MFSLVLQLRGPQLLRTAIMPPLREAGGMLTDTQRDVLTLVGFVLALLQTWLAFRPPRSAGEAAAARGSDPRAPARPGQRRSRPRRRVPSLLAGALDAVASHFDPLDSEQDQKDRPVMFGLFAALAVVLCVFGARVSTSGVAQQDLGKQWTGLILLFYGAVFEAVPVLHIFPHWLADAVPRRTWKRPIKGTSYCVYTLLYAAAAYGLRHVSSPFHYYLLLSQLLVPIIPGLMALSIVAGYFWKARKNSSRSTA